MDAESSSNESQPKMESTIEYPFGTDIKVLRIKSSALWSLSGGGGGHGHGIDQTVGIVRQGDFSFHVMVQTQSRIMITICMVDDLQWPVTKDTPVIRVGPRSFAFAMPGLLYGLQFSDDGYQKDLEAFVKLLVRFGHYEDHSSGREAGIHYSLQEEDGVNFWATSQYKIENITQPFLTQLGATTDYKSHLMTAYCMMNFETSNRQRLLKVMRMSAITKMITKGILVGGIHPNEHIELFYSPNHFTFLRTNYNEEDTIYGIDSRASPTIFAFSDIVEAIEAYGVVVSGKYQSMPPYEPKWNPLPNITFWNISKAGLIRILQVMVASATMNINHEVTGDSTDQENKPTMRDIKKEHHQKVAVEPMDEDPNIYASIRNEEIVSSGHHEFMEEEVRPHVEEQEGVHNMENNNAEENDEVITAPIREIKFPIINEPDTNSTIGPEKNRVEELREACAGMEVA
ncbi:hypothetical protein MKX01_032241 [Papaver californicum]|nr:hypothetical protein MKX01_032241 [Papaver californicum]